MTRFTFKECLALFCICLLLGVSIGTIANVFENSANADTAEVVSDL